MTERPSARPRTAALKIKTKSADTDEFAVQFRNSLSPHGVFVRTQKPLPLGRELRFEYLLADGSVVVGGRGKVTWSRTTGGDEAPPGMGIAITELTAGADVLGAAGSHRWGAPSLFELGAASEPRTVPSIAAPPPRGSRTTGVFSKGSTAPATATPAQAPATGLPQGALAASAGLPPPPARSSIPPAAPAPSSHPPARKTPPPPAPAGALVAGPAPAPLPEGSRKPAVGAWLFKGVAGSDEEARSQYLSDDLSDAFEPPPRRPPSDAPPAGAVTLDTPPTGGALEADDAAARDQDQDLPISVTPSEPALDDSSPTLESLASSTPPPELESSPPSAPAGRYEEDEDEDEDGKRRGASDRFNDLVAAAADDVPSAGRGVSVVSLVLITAVLGAAAYVYLAGIPEPLRTWLGLS